MRWHDVFLENAVELSLADYRHSVGELRQDGIDRRWNVKFVGSAHLPPKKKKPVVGCHNRLFRHCAGLLHSSGQMVVKKQVRKI